MEQASIISFSPKKLSPSEPQSMVLSHLTMRILVQATPYHCLSESNNPMESWTSLCPAVQLWKVVNRQLTPPERKITLFKHRKTTSSFQSTSENVIKPIKISNWWILKWAWLHLRTKPNKSKLNFKPKKTKE